MSKIISIRAMLSLSLVLALTQMAANGGAGGGTDCDAATGADVIVGDLYDVTDYGSVGDRSAFAVGTYSCNIGTDDFGTDPEPDRPRWPISLLLAPVDPPDGEEGQGEPEGGDEV